VDLAGRRAYLLQTAEKGIIWLRLVAHGRAGHGSQTNPDNAVTRLAGRRRADRRARVAGRGPGDGARVPRGRAATSPGRRVATGDGTALELDVPALRELLGTTARWVEATVRNTSNPTVLEAGVQAQRHPGHGHRR
jgi:acetylornithine deacetylase/succinyl-diaminopimelate desuccinylase-like protein